MSKIGDKSIEISSNVTVFIEGEEIKIKSTHGELNFSLPKNIKIEKKDNSLIVKATRDDKKTKSLHGLYRQLIANAVIGVEKPWEREMEIVGTGYGVKLQGEDLVFKLGYSHPVIFKKQLGISYKVKGTRNFFVIGIDKQLVGQVAYQIKILRKPDPYKGKGIRYRGEQIKLKPGKKAKATIGS